MLQKGSLSEKVLQEAVMIAHESRIPVLIDQIKRAGQETPNPDEVYVISLNVQNRLNI